MALETIENRVRAILNELPPSVLLVAAAKTRTVAKVEAAIRGGIKILGYNYVQEAEKIHQSIKRPVQWHLIGHLQRNKARHAVKLFDMIETIDSARLAREVDHQCARQGKKMPVLIEINSGREPNKSGVMPEQVAELAREISQLPNLALQGLMTMAPYFDDPEATRPYFKATKAIFDRLKGEALPNIEMRYLSMGMSHSYAIAIEEGANMVRVGTKLFGPRED